MKPAGIMLNGAGAGRCRYDRLIRRSPLLQLSLCCATLLAGLAGSGAVGAEESSMGLYRSGQLVDTLGLETSAKMTQSTFLQEAGPAQIAPSISADTQFRNATFRNATLPAADIHERLRKLAAEGLAVQDSDIEFLRTRHADFLAAQGDIRAGLMEIGQQAEAFGLDPVILERHRQTVDAFEAGIEEFSRAVEAVLQDRDGALADALEVMARLKAREDPQLLNSNPPYAMQKIEAPRLSREDADRALRAELAESPISTQSAPPTPDDLAATPEIQLTQEIIDQAAALGNSPLAIFEFVHNQVRFEAYRGSRKGAVDTLRQLRGNDVDQVSLLLALLRVSGIPSRYVRGTIELDIESAKDWLGVDDGYTAGAILATAGLDGVTIVNGPNAVAVRFTHVWAEAYVPYGNYRGVPNDATGSLWVALDPSFKGSVVTPGEDVLSAMGFDIDAYLADHISTFTEPSPIEQLVLDVQAYLDANDPGKTVADIERRIDIEAQELGLLPASAQGNVLAVQGTFSELEENQRYKVRFHLYDGGTPFIDHTLNVLDLAGKRLTIEYVGATPADQATIDSFNGLYNTPPNLVQVRPLLKLDNAVVATGVNGIGMGYTHSFDMQFLQPAGASNVQPLVQNQIIAGNGHAIAFDTFLDVRDNFFDVPAYPADALLESLLHTTAADYLSRVDRGQETASRLMGMVTTQDVSEAIVKNAISVAFSSGVPVTFEWTGLVVDADRRIVGPFAADGDSSKARPYMVLTGMDGSTHENQVFEDIFDQNAISTIKILELASDLGVSICTITTSILIDCPGFSHAASVSNAVNNALASGNVVTIPAEPITVSLWSGTGYIDMDPVTGAAGYIISGGINGDVQVAFGGATVDSWDIALPCEAVSVTGEVLVPPADSPDAGAVFCANDSFITFQLRLTTVCEDGSEWTKDMSLTTHFTTKQLGPGDYDLNLNFFGTTTIRKITIGEVRIDSLNPAANLKLGDNLDVNYTVDLAGHSLDSAELHVKNNVKTLVFKKAGIPTASGSHTTTWDLAKWNQPPHSGAYANPKNSNYNSQIKGMFKGQPCDSNEKGVNTKLVVESEITDKLPAGATATRVSGLDDILDPLKVVMKMGANETIISGPGSIKVTDKGSTPTVVKKVIEVDDPALNNLPDGVYSVILRDLRDEIGNFTDPPPSHPLEIQ
jgi:transglutaminase-like putative cysteine protease